MSNANEAGTHIILASQAQAPENKYIWIDEGERGDDTLKLITPNSLLREWDPIPFYYRVNLVHNNTDCFVQK